MNFKKQLKEGLLTKNPVFVQLLGMCSTLAITTSLFNGLGMGISVTIILICSNVLISALRKVIPSNVRIAAYIVIIAGFVTIVDLMLRAYRCPVHHVHHPGAAGLRHLRRRHPQRR